MLSLSFISWTFVSLLVVELQGVYGAVFWPPYVPASCVKDINAARGKVGLQPLREATGEEKFFFGGTSEHQSELLHEICKSIVDLKPLPESITGGDRTVAVNSFYNMDNDCRVAVQSWKRDSKYNGFDSRPPVFRKGGPLDNPSAMNVFSIFNPRENATVECVFVTCTSRTRYPTLSRLLCATSPAAVQDGEAPFTEEQWNRIRE